MFAKRSFFILGAPLLIEQKDIEIYTRLPQSFCC